MGEFLLKADNTSPLAQAIREACGVDPNEDIHVMTPTFDRPLDWDPAMIPPAKEDGVMWRRLAALAREDLRAWGCRPWSTFSTERPNGNKCAAADAVFFDTDDDETRATHELWLFPAEWYADIPDGFPVTDINGCTEAFKHGETDDDRRFGLLAYGVMIPLRSAP